MALAVQADRGRIYRTVDKARIAAGISRGAWEKVEAGASVKVFTLAAVEEALNWPAGRAARIIAGTDEGAEPTADVDLRQYILNKDLPRHIKSAMIALLDSMSDDESPNREVRGT